MRSLAMLLLVPACFYSSSSKPATSIAQPGPGQPTTTDLEGQPAPYEQAPTILSQTAKPTTTNAQPEVQPVTVTAWSLFKTADGCATAVKIECTTGTCAPPPQQTYACLGGVKLPATIVSNGDTCSLDCPAAPCRAVPCPAL
ncbi:MAG TPA: hypothetical protein VGL61_28330 [Kofleriaceae bacterium]|jgi:hypothetical protein